MESGIGGSTGRYPALKKADGSMARTAKEKATAFTERLATLFQEPESPEDQFEDWRLRPPDPANCKISNQTFLQVLD